MRESPVSPSLSATALLTEQISAAPVAANGGSAVSPSTTEPRQAPPAHALPSHVSYQIRMQTDARGLCVPIELGVGNFARVLRGVQLNAGQEVRAVAIKILHSNATYADELLFRHEIDLLRSLSDADSVNVIRALDVLQLGPMILCGCGTIYEPLCPMGCRQLLVRRDSPDRPRPSLHCSGCGYELPGHQVEQRQQELFAPPAKPCCKEALPATLINFVNRDALVMELIDTKLEEFAERRRRSLAAANGGLGQRLLDARRSDGVVGRLLAAWNRNRLDVLHEKVMLLEKTLLMVQLAESVAWLHGSKRIIHKDLTPDNVMVRFTGTAPADDSTRTSAWRGELPGGLRELLNNMASYPTFTVQVIDFGLADRDQPSRSWYDDSTAIGHKKAPFLSPEAQRLNRTQEINASCRLVFEHEAGRFQVPPDLVNYGQGILAGDVLVDRRDYEHRHDLKITKVEGGYAYYEGSPPQGLGVQSFELVRPLCEPHDIYALGAIYYYLLTENYRQVDSLRGLVEGLEQKPCALTAAALRDRDLYPSLRAAIREKHWQDEMMILILQAMTRGLPESFAQRRIDRGPELAQRFLRAAKQLYYRMQQEILSARNARLRLATAAGGLLVITGLSGGLLWQGRQLRHEKDAAVEQAAVKQAAAAAKEDAEALRKEAEQAQKERDGLKVKLTKAEQDLREQGDAQRDNVAWRSKYIAEQRETSRLRKQIETMPKGRPPTR